MNYKGQEEVVGFVFIVLIVVIGFILFLGFSSRGNNSELNLESAEVYNFLESSLDYTSDCAVNFEPNYLKLGSLLRECQRKEGNCISGIDKCKVLNETFANLLEKSFSINSESYYKGYELVSIYSSNDSANRELVNAKKGSCSNKFVGSEIFIPAYPGTITTSLKLCVN